MSMAPEKPRPDFTFLDVLDAIDESIRWEGEATCPVCQGTMLSNDDNDTECMECGSVLGADR